MIKYLIVYFLIILTAQIKAQNEENSSDEIADVSSAGDSSGTLIYWQKEINSGISAPLLCTEEKIFIAAEDGIIFCFDLNRRLIWNYETAGTIGSRLTMEGSLLIAAAEEGDLFSFDAEAGELLQVIGLGESITSPPLIIPVSKRGEKSKGVIAGTSGGNLYCYDLFSFELIWENNSADTSIAGEILYAKDRLLFTASDKQVFCIDARTGIINWRWKNPKSRLGYNDSSGRVLTAAADGKKVYIFDHEEQTLTAIDLLLGTPLWQKKEIKGGNSLVISSDNKKLYIPGDAGSFYIIAADNGKLINEIKNNFDPGEIFCEPMEWNGNIVFGSSRGRIYLISGAYDLNTVFSVAGASINSVKRISKNIFAASSSEGRIIVFELNNLKN